MSTASVSIIIPTFNGGKRIARCLDSLLLQSVGREVEILVVDDGSTDDTAELVRSFPSVKLLTQVNSGPAAARNRGAREAQGKFILFTDDDCVPTAGWIDAMLASFDDPQVVGAKGVYRTRQRELVARFVQVEYEDRYRIMSALSNIDFIDTYSAGFVRERFLEMGGYDTSFPVACAEDAELSYRMSALGWQLKFQPAAVVYHTHPASMASYLKKKYKFAFWRVLAVHKNPRKGISDSHTPQLMKLQLLFLPGLLVATIVDALVRPARSLTLLVLIVFCISTVPFVIRAMKSDRTVALLSPAILAARACAQLLGVMGGVIYVHRFIRKARPVLLR